MDKDLISYFDQRFDEAVRQIVGETTRQIVGETTRQIEALRKETIHQIEVLRRETTKRFEQVDQRFEQVDQRFEQVDQRFGKLEAEIRHTQVLVEDLRSDLQGVAEGVVNVNEKLDRYVEHADRQREEDRAANRVLFANHEKRLSLLESAAAHP